MRVTRLSGKSYPAIRRSSYLRAGKLEANNVPPPLMGMETEYALAIAGHDGKYLLAA